MVKTGRRPFYNLSNPLVVRGCRKIFEVGKRLSLVVLCFGRVRRVCSCIENLLPTKLVGRRFSWSLIGLPIIGNQWRTGCRPVSDGHYEWTCMNVCICMKIAYFQYCHGHIIVKTSHWHFTTFDNRCLIRRLVAMSAVVKLFSEGCQSLATSC